MAFSNIIRDVPFITSYIYTIYEYVYGLLGKHIHILLRLKFVKHEEQTRTRNNEITWCTFICESSDAYD